MARSPAPQQVRLAVTAGASAIAPVELRWTAAGRADFYRVYRDGVRLADTAVPYFLDSPEHPTAAYTVEASGSGKMLARSDSVLGSTPARASPETPSLTARGNRRGVVLRWPAAQSLWTSGFVMRRRRADSGAPSVDVARVTASQGAEQSTLDSPPPGEWVYEISACGASGNEGKSATARLSFPPARTPTPAVDWPLTERPADVQQVGLVTFGPTGAEFHGGYLEIPSRDGLDMGDGLTVQFEFRAGSVEGMPVLLCHGLWQVDGWFVQILGGRLTIRTPSGDAQGPVIETGRWYKVQWSFDGQRQCLSVDGRPIPQLQETLTASSAARPLVIGQYEAKDPSFAFHGAIRNLRIVPDVE